MNWRNLLCNRAWLPKPFIPWNIFVPAEPETKAAPVPGNPARLPPKIDTDANVEDAQPINADGSPAISAPLTRHDEDDWDEWLGIGACTIAPWPARGEDEERMPKCKTICVSERDIGRVRKLVSAALSTHSGAILEYVRVLSRELSQATVLPPARLPPGLVTLNSKIWATDMENGQNMVVILVMPHQTGDRAGRISILSPLGMALFGYEAGDRIDWGPVYRPIRLHVDRVKHNRCPLEDHRPADPRSSGATRRKR